MTYEPMDANWDKKVRDSFHRQTFLQTLGAEIETIAPGYCTLTLSRRVDLCQQHGFIHAGVTATLADTAAGYAAFSLMPSDSTVLTAEFKINLLAPASGNSFSARARVVKPGRTLTTVACDVLSLANGEWLPIATFLGTMMCLQGKADSK